MGSEAKRLGPTRRSDPGLTAVLLRNGYRLSEIKTELTAASKKRSDVTLMESSRR
jgi:hypothetical protein